MRTIIDGRVHLNGALLRCFRDLLKEVSDSGFQKDLGGPAISTAAAEAMGEFLRHDELSEDRYLEIEIRGCPDDDLQPGMVLLICGPVSIECPADDLSRALRAFGGR